MPPRGRSVRATPEPPDLAPRLDPAPRVMESGAVWDGVEAGPDVEVPQHVADVALQESRWVGADLSGRRFTGLRCRDTEFLRCDLSGAVLDDAVLTRVAFVDCRLTGIVLSGATLADVRVSGGHGDLAVLRMAHVRTLLVEDTSWRAADLYAVRGKGCAFLRCDLSGASFEAAQLDAVRLHGSRLDDLRGAIALRGARISPDQIVTLGAVLLDALEIVVGD